MTDVISCCRDGLSLGTRHHRGTWHVAACLSSRHHRGSPVTGHRSVTGHATSSCHPPCCADAPYTVCTLGVHLVYMAVSWKMRVDLHYEPKAEILLTP